MLSRIALVFSWDISLVSRSDSIIRSFGFWGVMRPSVSRKAKVILWFHELWHRLLTMATVVPTRRDDALEVLQLLCEPTTLPTRRFGLQVEPNFC